MRRPRAFLGTVLALTAIAFFSALVLSPSRAMADVTVALDGLPQSGGEQVPMIPVLTDTAPTVTLTNLRTGSTHSGRMTLDGRVRITNVSSGYYQIRITSKHRFHIGYIEVDEKGDTALRFNWEEIYFSVDRRELSDNELIDAMGETLTTATQTDNQVTRDWAVADLGQMQIVHRQALKNLESLGLNAIRAVGPQRFDLWRQIHREALARIDTVYEGTGSAPAPAVADLDDLKARQSDLRRQYQSEKEEIDTFTPKFLKRRQDLFERLPPTLQDKLTWNTSANPAAPGTVSETRARFLSELRDVQSGDEATAADLTRLKLLYDRMQWLYVGLSNTSVKLARIEEEIATATEAKMATDKAKDEYTTGAAAGDRGN